MPKISAVAYFMMAVLGFVHADASAVAQRVICPVSINMMRVPRTPRSAFKILKHQRLSADCAKSALKPKSVFFNRVLQGESTHYANSCGVVKNNDTNRQSGGCAATRRARRRLRTGYSPTRGAGVVDEVRVATLASSRQKCGGICRQESTLLQFNAYATDFSGTIYFRS